MDDDLIDVLIVLGVLGLGLVGLLILLAINVKRVRNYLLCCRREKDVPIKPKRATIKVVRKANTITVEEARSKASRTPAARIFSSPLPRPEQLPSPMKAKELIYIVPRTPTYRAEIAASTSPAYMSSSTTSSYLPSQIPPLTKRRCSA
ncbi:hypothetical protein V3C99_006433 [Haemonchus contortus]|uniref:Uncharacterized protein n=1 Tax=Haemonchus contortus TaxID=6289 RepID=A0A7I4XRM9_HAECO